MKQSSLDINSVIIELNQRDSMYSFMINMYILFYAL